MPLRIAELEADALGGRVGCFFGPVGVEKASGEDQKRLGIVRVGREDGAGGSLSVAEAPQRLITLREHQLELHFARAFFPDALERLERRVKIFFLDRDRRPDKIGLLGAAEGFGSFGDRGVGLVEEAELHLAGGEHLGIVGAERGGMKAVFEQRQRLFIALSIHAGPGDVPVVFPVGLGGGLAGVVGDLVDIAEGHELLEERLVGPRPEAFSFPLGIIPRLPRRHGLHRPLGSIKNLFEDAALHVGADRQAKPVEDRGCDIEEPGAVNELVALEPRAAGDEHALRPVPDGDPGRHPRRELRPEVIAVKAVVGDENDRRVGAGELHEPAEEEIVELVDPGDDLLVELEVGLGDPLHPRRMVGHEHMADLVDRAVVDRHEVPVGLGLEQMRGGVVGGAGFGELFGEPPKSLVLGLIDRVGRRHEEPDQIVRIDVVRADPQVVHRCGELRRPGGAGGRRGPLGRILPRLCVRNMAEHVGDDAAGMILLAMRGKPADDMAPQPATGKNLPERPALSRGGRDWHDGARAGVHFREPRHAVVIRHLSRGDARPEHRGELRLERRQIAAGACLDEPGKARQLARIEERMDDLPVGRIPADKQEPLATLLHGLGRHGG